MNKKIIAVLCVVILMASLFSACGKKKMYTVNIGGIDRPVVTDANGVIVTNEYGKVAAYYTNADGETVTDENKNPNINYFDAGVPANYIHPNGALTYEVFYIPAMSGWKAVDTGKMVKDGTDMKCYIAGSKEQTLNEDETFITVMDKRSTSNRDIIAKMNNGEVEGVSKGEMTEVRTKFGEYDAYHTSYTVYDTAGKVIYHAENFYFVTKSGEIYSINYISLDGTGYDASFNFVEWVQNNVKVTIPKKSAK